MKDLDLASPRPLTPDESSSLAALLRPHLRLSNVPCILMAEEDATDILNYALELVGDGETLGRVLEELALMELEICDGEALQKIRISLSDYLMGILDTERKEWREEMIREDRSESFAEDLKSSENHVGIDFSGDGMAVRRRQEMEGLLSGGRRGSLKDRMSMFDEQGQLVKQWAREGDIDGRGDNDDSDIQPEQRENHVRIDFSGDGMAVRRRQELEGLLGGGRRGSLKDRMSMFDERGQLVKQWAWVDEGDVDDDDDNYDMRPVPEPALGKPMDNLPREVATKKRVVEEETKQQELQDEEKEGDPNARELEQRFRFIQQGECKIEAEEQARWEKEGGMKKRAADEEAKPELEEIRMVTEEIAAKEAAPKAAEENVEQQNLRQKQKEIDRKARELEERLWLIRQEEKKIKAEQHELWQEKDDIKKRASKKEDKHEEEEARRIAKEAAAKEAAREAAKKALRKTAEHKIRKLEDRTRMIEREEKKLKGQIVSSITLDGLDGSPVEKEPAKSAVSVSQGAWTKWIARVYPKNKAAAKARQGEEGSGITRSVEDAMEKSEYKEQRMLQETPGECMDNVAKLRQLHEMKEQIKCRIRKLEEWVAGENTNQKDEGELVLQDKYVASKDDISKEAAKMVDAYTSRGRTQGSTGGRGNRARSQGAGGTLKGLRALSIGSRGKSSGLKRKSFRPRGKSIGPREKPVKEEEMVRTSEQRAVKDGAPKEAAKRAKARTARGRACKSAVGRGNRAQSQGDRGTMKGLRGKSIGPRGKSIGPSGETIGSRGKSVAKEEVVCKEEHRTTDDYTAKEAAKKTDAQNTRGRTRGSAGGEERRARNQGTGVLLRGLRGKSIGPRGKSFQRSKGESAGPRRKSSLL